VTLAARSLDQAERNRNQVRARVEQGVLPRFDLLRAEVEVANRRPGLTRARNDELLAGEELRRVLALPLDAPLVLTDTLGFEPFPLTREAVVEEALDTRPDLAAARTEARAARTFLRAQAHNDLPLLYLDGNYTWQGQTSNGMIPGDNESAQSAALGLTVTWPILDGWDNRARTRQAESRAVQAELGASSLERAVRVEARAAWADVRSIAEELEGTRESILLAREALSIAETRYDNGLSTQLELLDADLALYQAELTRLETLYRYNVALAALDHAVGRGPALDPDEEAP
jgi:outer membrane protein TolC